MEQNLDDNIFGEANGFGLELRDQEKMSTTNLESGASGGWANQSSHTLDFVSQIDDPFVEATALRSTKRFKFTSSDNSKDSDEVEENSILGLFEDSSLTTEQYNYANGDEGLATVQGTILERDIEVDQPNQELQILVGRLHGNFIITEMEESDDEMFK